MKTGNNVPGHVFISYRREDQENAADALQHSLEAAGIRVWRDKDSLWPGQDWRSEIRRAITDGALVFISLFSANSVTRPKSYQNEELTLAVEQLRLRGPDSSWLIPVRLDDCVIPHWDIGSGRSLSSIQRVDLFGCNKLEGEARLVEAVLRILAGRCVDGGRGLLTRAALGRRSILIGGLAAIAVAGAATEQLLSERSARSRAHRPAQPSHADPVAVTKALVLTGQKGSVYAAFSPNGRILASGAEDGTIWLRAVGNWDRVKILRAGSGVTALAFSPNDRWLATGHEDASVRLWDLAHVPAHVELHGNQTRVVSVAFSPDSKTLASCCPDHTIWTWDVETRQAAPLLDYCPAYSVAFNPVNGDLASAAWLHSRGVIELWWVPTRNSLAKFGPGKDIVSVAFSPNGGTLASGGYGKIWLWDIESAAVTGAAKPTGILIDRSSWIQSLAFSPNGKLLASGSADATARIWNAATHQAVARFIGHEKPLKTVAFSVSGRILVTGSEDETVRVWQIPAQSAISS